MSRDAKLRLVPPLLAALLVTGACAQGTFQNLDFENGPFIPIPGDPFGRVEFGPAMPGWTGYVGTFIQFSNQPIPEPSAFGLFGLGILLLDWRFVRCQH